MDIVAHALWTNALYKGVQRRKRSWNEVAQITFWSDFPDLASFFVFGIYNFFTNGYRYQPGSEYAVPQQLAWLLSVLYSIPIFLGIFLLIWLIRRRPYWPLAAWLVHIVIDVFTHDNFFPPQFLWPLSSVTVHGIPWDTPWLWFFTYAFAVIVYAYWFFDLRAKESQG